MKDRFTAHGIDTRNTGTARCIEPYEQLAQSEQLGLIHRLLNELPEKQRSIMQLRDIEGKSYKEIADILQITEEQVKINLFRSRQKIKQRYTEIEDYGL